MGNQEWSLLEEALRVEPDEFSLEEMRTMYKSMMRGESNENKRKC